jgi:HSP20 family protein
MQSASRRLYLTVPSSSNDGWPESQSDGGDGAASGRAMVQGAIMNITRLPSLFTSEPFGIDNAFRSFMRPYRWETGTEAPEIKMDVTEVDKAYLVKAEIPGVRKEDIHVEIDGAQVMITAEVKKDVEEKKEGRLLRSERSYGFASRTFSLGFEVDRAKAVAKYEDGVLTLTLPKLMSAHVEPLKVE